MNNVHSIVNQRHPLEDQLSEAQGVLPTQFYGTCRGSSPTEPCRRLIAVMLLDALRCYQGNYEAKQGARHQQFTEADAWIYSDKDDNTFSFTAVCDALEVDPETIRKDLLCWKEGRLAGENMRMIEHPAPPARRISTSRRVGGVKRTSPFAAARRIVRADAT